jgi:CRISPR-associated protein Csx17
LKWTNSDTIKIRPLSGLRPEWLKGLDGTEFRLAASLAGMRANFGKAKGMLWLRQHLEPLEINSSADRTWVSWLKTPGNDIVWHDGDLTTALNAILTRRIQRVETACVAGWPDWSPRCAKLEDITAFIEGRTDDALLADLLWGLSLLDWQAVAHSERASWQQQKDEAPIAYDWKKDNEHRVVPSSFYALLKLCHRRTPQDGTAIPLVPAIHQRARSGDGLAASQLAARRLHASGQAPLVRELPVAADIARRTAASLIFPISPRDLSLLERTLQHPTENQIA